MVTVVELGDPVMSPSHRWTSRVSTRRLFVLTLVVFAALAIGRPGDASAAASPQPYLDDALKTQLYNNVTGASVPNTFPAEWAKPKVATVSRTAGFLPPIRMIGTIGLGVAAFELGWHIGRFIDTRWLHVSSQMTTAETTSGNAGCIGWKIAAKEWLWNTAIAPGYWILKFQTWRPDGTPNGVSYQWPASNNPCLGAYQAVVQNHPGGAQTVNGTTHWVATEGQMQGGLQVVDSPYTGQPYSISTIWSLPAESPAVIQAMRDAIAAEGPALANEINAALDSNNWQRPLPTTTPVGSIPADVGGPLLVEWLAPDVEETHAEYLARLRSAGWVGNAVVTSLTVDEADHAFRLGGVPCTSQSVGSSVARNASATFYVNPTNPLSAGQGSGGGSCGGGFASPAGGGCKFNDYISEDPTRGSWEKTINDWGPYVLDSECSEAWQILRDLGFVDSQGEPTQSGIDAAQDLSTIIANAFIREILPNHGLPIEDWRKVSIEQSGGVPLQTDAGNEFQLHFYRDLSGNIYTGHDFHIVFQDWFH